MQTFIAGLKKGIQLLIIYIFNLLPVKTNKIFMFSYYGSQYGCNPKYITQYILAHYPENKFEIVWAFNDPASKQHLNGFRKVKMMSLRYFYDLCTSKVVITNFRTTDLFIKRKSQYYIQTWHSSLRLKQIEKDAEDSLPEHYVKMAQKDSMKCDLLLSGCEYSTSIFKRSFWYEGEIFEYGTPRNDVLIRNDPSVRENIVNKLGIDYKCKIALYAPTFRKDHDLYIYELDYPKISENFKKKFGGDWIFLVRLHPHLISKSNRLSYTSNFIDVTTYDDIQELLGIADVLITDYSSLMFDYAITRRPCFLYVPDVEEYISKDRSLYFDLVELPFISAVNQDELLCKIDEFNVDEYRNDLYEFINHLGTYEDGNASKNLVNRIDEVCFKNKGRKLYETI